MSGVDDLAHERELAWAPPNVADDLRATALARREHAAQATLIRAHARAGNAQLRAERLARAQAHQQVADSLELRETILADVDTQRARWHDATGQARASAREATEELRRRFPAADLDPFHRDVRERAGAPEPVQPGTPQCTASTAQPELGSAELRRAAELAEAARRTLDERNARVQRDAELERQRQADEPSPDRWPHRDPATNSLPCSDASLCAPPRRLRPRTSVLPSLTWRTREGGQNPTWNILAAGLGRPNEMNRKPLYDRQPATGSR